MSSTMDSTGSDIHMEMAEKEKMLEQLKLMVREKDEILQNKNSELQEAKASLSKFKLQSKAKITKLSHQLEEAKKASTSDNASDKSSECGDETPSEQTNRAKMKLLRRKLEEKDRLLKEKDEQLTNRDQQVVAKEKIIDERNQVIHQREEMIHTINKQLHERDKIISDFSQSEKQPSGEQIDQIYAQILYKDKLIVELNNKILELDRKIIDLQEFAGEKDEVIKGRDKVITILQTSIVEKDQNVTSQSALIKNLTSKVEANEENMSLLTEKLEKAEHSLKVESERFNLRLNETQRYFEETLSERESEISQLRTIIRDREKDIATRDNDLRELLLRHEQDLQEIMSRGEGSMQDHVVKMLEQKLKDINGVLDSKVQVIEVLTNEVANKNQQLLDLGNTVKALKEKLAVSSEQNLLQQQTFADLEMQWKVDKSKLEMRLSTLSEKLEEEKGELNLQLHALQMSLRQYEAAYSQAAIQYNALQQRYQQTYLEVQTLKGASTTATPPADKCDPSPPSTEHLELVRQLESETALRKKLEEQVNFQEEEITRLQKLPISESFSGKADSDEKSNVGSNKQRESPEKVVVSPKGGSKTGDKPKSVTDSPGSKVNEAKLLKVKAQYTAKIKALEKEVQELKKGGGGIPVSPDVETLQNRLAEVEEEKGNLMLHLVDFDDTRALQGQLEQQLSGMQKQNQSLQDETQHLQQQLQEAQLETSHLLEKISQLQQMEEQMRTEFANEKTILLTNEESQKMQLNTQLNQLREECIRLTNQIEEDDKQRDCLHKQLEETQHGIDELRGQVQASNAAVEELQKNLVERSEQTSKLAGEKVGLEIRAAELEEIRDKLEQEKFQLLTKIEFLQNQTEHDTQPNTEFENENRNLQEKLQELNETISKERGISKTHKDQINELLPKLQEMQNEKQQLEKEKNEMKQHLMTLTQTKEETDALLQETKSVLESLQTNKQQREESLNKILQERDKEREDLQKELADTYKMLNEQTEEISCICKALEIEEISVQQLSVAVQNRLSVIADLQLKLEKTGIEFAATLEMATKQEAEIDSLKLQLKNYKKQNETSVQNMAEESDSYKENLLIKDQTIQLLQETVESQNNEMQKFHELQKARDQILSSLELKVEEYECTILEKDKEHSSRVQSLESQMESLEKEFEMRAQEVSDLKSQQTILSKELENKMEEIHELKMQHTTKLNDAHRLQAEMDDEMKILKDQLQSKTESLTKQLEQNEEHSKEFIAKISKLQDKNATKDAKIESLIKSVSEFSEKCRELSRLNSSVNNEKECLAQQLQEYRMIEEMAQGLLLEKQLETLPPIEREEGQQPASLMHSYIVHLSTQLQKLNAIKSQAETSLLESKKQNETLQNKLQDVEALCSEKDSQLLNWKSDSSEHEIMMRALVEERDQKISSLQQEIRSVNIVLEEKSMQEVKTQSQLTSLQENLLIKVSEFSNINSQLEMARQVQAGMEDELDILRDELLSKKTTITELQASMAEQQQKVSDLSENFQIALHEKEALHVEMVNVQKELMLVTNMKIALTKELTDSKQAIAEQEQTLSKLTSDLLTEKNTSKTELESRDVKIRELEKSYAELQSTSFDLFSKMKNLENQVIEEKKSKEILQEKQKETELQNNKLLQELIEKDTDKQHLDEACALLTEERNDNNEQLAISSQTVSDQDNTFIELIKENASISQKIKNGQSHIETVTEEKNQWEEKAVENQSNFVVMEAEILKLKSESEEGELQAANKLQVSNMDAAHLQKEIEMLRSELESVREKNEEIRAAELIELEKREELNKEIEFLRLEKHECDLDLNNFKVTLQEKEDLIQNLMLTLDESKGMKEKMEEEQVTILQEKESVLETVVCENKELKQTREELSIKIKALTDEKDLIRKKLDDLKKMESEKQSLTSKLEKASSEKETLKTKLKEAVAKIQSLGSKLKKAVSEKTDLDTKMKAALKEKETLDFQLKESISKKEILNTSLKETLFEKDDLNVRLKSVLSENNSLTAKFQEIEFERDGLLEKLREKTADEESFSDKIGLENEQLKNQLTLNETDLEKVKKEKEELLKDFSIVKLELKSLEEKKNQLDGFKIQLNAALEENDALRAENKDLNSSLERSLHEKDIVADELAQVDMKLVAAIQEKTKTRNHLEQVMRDHNKCADMGPRLEKALRDKRLLTEELSEVDGKLVQLLDNKEKLSKQLAESEHKLEEALFEKQELFVLNEQLSKDLTDQKTKILQMELEIEERQNVSDLKEEILRQKELINQLKLKLESKVSVEFLENKESKMAEHNKHLSQTLAAEESKALGRVVELEEKLLHAETEISKLTKLYSEQACESERLFQSKTAEIEHLNECLVQKNEEISAAQSKRNELIQHAEFLEKEMTSISNALPKAFEDLSDCLVKGLNPLLAELDGGNLSCLNKVDSNESTSTTTRVYAEKSHKNELTATDLVFDHFDILKTQMADKLSKIEDWQSKVVENGKNDRASLEKSRLELEESRKQQESQSKLVKKLAQNLKKIKAELSEKGKALEHAGEQQKELESLLIKERFKIKEAKDDLYNFFLSSFSPDVQLDESKAEEIELLSVIEDLKSKVVASIGESDNRISELNLLLQAHRDQIFSLEETISITNCTANAKVELSKELQERYSECCRQLEEMHTKMTELTEEFSAAKKENLQLMQVTKKLKESRSQKMTEVEELKQQLVDSECENQKFQSIVKELQEKVDNGVVVETNMEKELSKRKEEFDRKHLELVSLKDSVETLKTNHEEIVQKLNAELARSVSEIKELNESLENLKKSSLSEKELFEQNSEIAGLKNSLKEAESCVVKLKLDTEAKELKISSLNEATQILRLELDKCHDELQKKSSDDIVAKENCDTIHRLKDLNSSFFGAFNDINNDIQNEIESLKSRKKLSITEDMKDTLGAIEYLQNSVITSVKPANTHMEDDLCILNENQPESGLVFLKWLRGYLSNLWALQEKEYVNVQNIVFELNTVVTSKEKTNEDLMDKLDNLLVERRKMSERVASLKTMCDEQKSFIKTHSSDVQKMKLSMEAAGYEIFELLTSVKKANSSSLSTIVEENEDSADDKANENQEDVCDAGESLESFPHQLHALQSLAKQVTLLIEAFSRTDGLCSAQDKEILELRERLKSFENQQCQVASPMIELEIEKQMANKLFNKTDSSKIETFTEKEEQKVHTSCQNEQAENTATELQTMAKELMKAKEETSEMMAKLAAAQKHVEDLEERLAQQTEIITVKETHLEDIQNQLVTVQSQLESANITIHQLQSTSSDFAKGQEKEVDILKSQLKRREEQCQNLSLQLTDFIQNSDEQQLKLADKDEKIQSLLENMQELEEQLTSLGNQREADITKLSTELAEKTASLEEIEKRLQTKETQYLKVLSTAKKLKQHGEALKEEAEQAKRELKAVEQKTTLPPEQAVAPKEMLTAGDLENKSSERLQDLTTQVESFSEYCQQLQLQVQALTEKLHTADQLVNTKQMQLEALQAVSDEKESLAASQNTLLEGFETRLLALQDEKETLANVVVGKEELIQTLRDRVEELERKLNSLETETEKDARIRLLNEQLDESSKTMHTLQEEISLREDKLQESQDAVQYTKNEYEKIVEQMKEQREKAEETIHAKHELSEQLAVQMFDISEQLQVKSIRVEELSCSLQSSEEKLKLFEVELAEKESSLINLKQQLQTAGEESFKLVNEVKKFQDLYNFNQEQLTTQQKELETKERDLLNIQKEVDGIKEFLQKENLLQQLEAYLKNPKSEATIRPSVVQTNMDRSEPVPAADEKPLDATILEFPDPDFSEMYESLKLEFDFLFSEKEQLTIENFELKKLLTDTQHKEEEVLLKQQSYETRIKQLEDSVEVSNSTMASLEANLENVSEKLKQAEEENQHLTLQMAAVAADKNVDDALVREKEDAIKVPFVEKVEQKFQGPLHQVRIERDSIQRSAIGEPTKDAEELKCMKDLYEKLTDEHNHLKNKLQVTEAKCEKMLIKLKSFKEKNDSLSLELSQFKDPQNPEGISSALKALESEKQKHQETQNLLLAEQAALAKEKSKTAKMETAFRNKFQEVLDEKNHLSGSCNQLKTKCKELGGRLKELLAEREDLQDSIDRLTSESETALESLCNEHAVETSSLQNKVLSLEVECKNTYEDLKDFQNLVTKMKNNQESLKSENQKLKDTAHRLESEMVSRQTVETKIGQLEVEVQGLQEERNSLQDQADTAREESLSKMKELQTVGKKLNDAEGKIKLQEETLTKLKEFNETLHNAKCSLEDGLQATQHQLECAQKEKNTLSEEVIFLRQSTANTEILKGELASVENEVERKEQSVVLFKREVEALNEQVQSLTSQCRDLESTRQAITVLKKENNSLTEDVIKLNRENAELTSAKEELAIVSDRYNNLLEDNTALAKQIEELLTKLQKQSQLEKDLSFAHEQHGHLEREQATFIQRIEELEEQSQQLTNENTGLKQEMVHVNSSLKQVQFENESLKSQLQVMQSGGDRLSRFQEEYEKLQQQFAQSVEQNNQVQAELNHSSHRLQLREARCQQLAMQVSQLAEDRSYLNIQMGNLSLSLREKEKEASNLSSQCKTWYKKHCQLQEKVTELETSRAESLKLANSQSLTQEIETLKNKIQELEVFQEEMTKLNLEQTSQFTSEREQRLLAETNLVQLQEQIKIMQQNKTTQDYQIQIDEDQDRIVEAQPLLSRHGSSYLQRLQRWMMVKNRQLSRLMRLQPGVRTLVRIYFLFLHIIIVACIMGFL